MLGIPYRVKSVSATIGRDEVKSVILTRDDGLGGWLEIKGPYAQRLQVGERYTITAFTEEQPNRFVERPGLWAWIKDLFKRK